MRKKDTERQDLDEPEAVPEEARRAFAPRTDARSRTSLALGPGPPLPRALRRRLGTGKALAPGVRRFFEDRLGIDLSTVRLYTGAAAESVAADVSARGFAFGPSIVLRGQTPDAAAWGGMRLLAHELGHVLQQCLRESPGAHPRRDSAADLLKMIGTDAAGVLRRTPVCGAATVDPEALSEEEIYPPDDRIPDDLAVDDGVDWPDACEANLRWWDDLLLEQVAPIRDHEPELQPRAWSNKTLQVQRLLFEAGVRRVEGAELKRDGILGPRTLLGLLRVAEDGNHPARASVQGLGFDLDAVLVAHDSIARARAFARKAEFLLEAPIDVLGEKAVRYYDQNFYMGIRDRSVLDHLIFGGDAPEGVRREDRIELLKRLYGAGGQELHGTVAVVRVQRDFIHSLIDFERAVRRDDRHGIDRQNWFAFSAQNQEQAGALVDAFGVDHAITERGEELSSDQQEEVLAAINAITARTGGAGAARRPTELSAILLAVYLPVLDEAVRAPVVESYLAEKAQREEAERERIETHNREAAHERAERLVALIEAEDMYRPLRMASFETELNRGLREKQFFDLVLDDLAAREGNLFVRLYDEAEETGSDRVLAALVELSRAGRYANHPRVRRAQGTLIERHGELRRHGYIVTGGGAVLLGGEDRLEVGEVAGAVNSHYLRDEDREQLKPDAERRLTNELERQSRDYMLRLLAGEEPERTQDEVGRFLLSRAWTEAGLDPDSDLEDVEFQESLRLLGVRSAGESADGVPRYEVQYEVVQRIVGGVGGDTEWTAVEGSRHWRGESDFEYDLFWYGYSQTADIVETAAIVVSAGAVLVIAWEVGLLAALVSAGGGALPVGAAITISVAIYMLTHERWTLEGLLLAGVEGYLAAVGFRVFAPVGQAAARLVIPATLEQVAFRRVVAAWLIRHGTTGALAGGATAPATLFVEDLLRVAREGGGFHSFSEYLRAAGWGMVLGAVFEIGGSVLLAPIFRAADRTVLSKLDDVVALLRGHEPRVTPAQWLSEATGALSNLKGWLANTMDDVLADGLYAALRDRMRQAGSRFLAGTRTTIHRQLLEMAGSTPLSREAVDGLERLLRLSEGTLDDDALATLLQQARNADGRAEPWLRFLAGVDESVASGLIQGNRLGALLDAEAVLALAARRSPAEVAGLLASRFGDSLDDLSAFAGRLNALDDTAADRLLGLLDARGTAVTPRALMRMAESGAGLDDEVVSGLERLTGRVDAARLDAVLEAMADDQVGAFLRSARTAGATELEAIGRVVAAHEPATVAWAVRLPVAEAETLLNALSADARAVITDITAAEARDLVAALGIDAVNNALSLGASGPVRGSHLRSLLQRLHRNSVSDLLGWAGTASNRLGRVAALATNLEAAAARLPAGPALESGSLILDTNATAAIDELLRRTTPAGDPISFADLDPNRQDAINAIRAARGLGPYADPPGGARPTIADIVGSDADLRGTVVVAGEIVQGEASTGTSRALAELTGVGPARGHADYPLVLDDLRASAVGKAKGAADRAVIADAMFADTAPGVTPRLVTTDQDIVTRLATNYAEPTPFVRSPGSVSTWDQIVAHYPSGRFRISIRGHRLEIVFRAPTAPAAAPTPAP